MAVFTTRSLLHALGVSRRGATSSAVAVNWVIKDGAGRIGKMVFARHGKKFDCDLKQVILQLWQQFSISLFVNVFSLVEHWIPCD
jgi:hypothetical protein